MRQIGRNGPRFNVSEGASSGSAWGDGAKGGSGQKGKGFQKGGGKGGNYNSGKGGSSTAAMSGGFVPPIIVGSNNETSKMRIPRLAASFAGALTDYIAETYATKNQLWEAWTSFCMSSSENPSRFGQALYLLVRWRVLARAGRDNFRLLTQTDPNFKKRAPADRLGALEGERPQLLQTAFASPVPLYPMPGHFAQLCALDVYKMQSAMRKVLAKQGLKPLEINRATYVEYQHAVLFAEEVQMKFDISLYDLEVTERLSFTRSRLYKIWVPGLAEKRPSVLRGDAVLLTCKQGKFTGYVHQVRMEEIEVSFHPNFKNLPPFKVHFDFTRTPLRSMHRAIDELRINVDSDQQFTRPGNKIHSRLNQEQSNFLNAALKAKFGKGSGKKSGTLPLLLWGPPGTGKTTTVVHTIHAILREQPTAKILVTAPSNPASDLICERLAELGVKPSQMLRLVAMMRDVRLLPQSVLPFIRTDSITGCFQVPDLTDLQAQRIIVATCTTASYIRSRLPEEQKPWFTHVFIDEAAQAMEAEALVPVTLLAKGGCLCLAGDFKQLGPVIRSPVAIEFGLQTSLMERIVNIISVNHSRVFTLLDTYRAHPAILSLYNKTVYADVLRCCCKSSSFNMKDWPDCPKDANGRPCPIIYHHCNGQEARNKDSPSWQNVMEGDIVKQYLMKLLAYGVEADDIGIISPYYKQCQRLNFICKGEGVDVEVGTTELFQGREKRVIIISTVRSRQEQEISNDLRFSLGFLGNYKRTNVALSRARSLLIVVGNLSLLSCDATWHNTIKLAREMRCLRGDRFEMQRPVHGENSEWGQSHGRWGGASNAAGGSGDGVVDRPWREHE
mmetsp:Transcript_24939/g.46077  ORF Transcript_24939/g.46077 Transcript_24939/m.46077 type:complete len:840 (-) Transcript_24939:145-2664(-)